MFTRGLRIPGRVGKSDPNGLPTDGDEESVSYSYKPNSIIPWSSPLLSSLTAPTDAFCGSPPLTAPPYPMEKIASLLCVLLIWSSFGEVKGRPDKETREKFYGNLVNGSKNTTSGEDSIADIFDRVLEKEFSDNDAPESKIFHFFSFSLLHINLYFKSS